MPTHPMKFWIAALVAAIFFLSCSEPKSNVDENSGLKTSHLLGRHLPVVKQVDTGSEDTHLSLTTGHKMGWPGSGMAFRFEGKFAGLRIEDSGKGIMDVVINGAHSQLDLNSGSHFYPIVSSKKRNVFDVRVTRRTEFYDTGYFTMGSPVYVAQEGENQAEPIPFNLRDRKILFLGDSITAGFGVGGDTKDCQNIPALHSPTESYAMLTAEMLEAESHLIAISGRGVVHNWDANPAPVMPAQIDLALPDQPDTKWDHSQFQPDVVVTLLGTNDWSVINPGQDRFRNGYREMLTGLRERFPKAHIVTIGGPLLDGEKGASIRDGIDWAMANLADENISTLDVTLSDAGLRWSCNYHPGRDSMKKIANALSAHIREIKGWEFLPLDLPAPHPIAPPDYMLPGGKAHFRERLIEIDAQPELFGGVLLAGDSITEGWRSQDIDLGVEVSNHGVGWDTVTGLKARLPQMLRHSPDKIFILIGTNDIGYKRDVQAMARELTDVIETLKRERAETEIYIQSVMPREQESLPYVNSINAAYRTAAERLNVNYIDLTPVFAASDGTLKAKLTYDGLHLNQKGYEVWAETLRSYINN